MRAGGSKERGGLGVFVGRVAGVHVVEVAERVVGFGYAGEGGEGEWLVGGLVGVVGCD